MFLSLTIPCISIKPGYLTFYALPIRTDQKIHISDITRENLKKNSPCGEISFKARRRISQAIDWLLYMSTDKTFYSPKHKRSFTFKLNFVTLTLASKQVHSDQFIKNRLLNQFLLEIKRDYGVRRYLWRAESQHNGNIHFHLITDKFIAWSAIRKTWNRIQNKVGYIDTYGCEMREHHKDGFKARPELFKTWDLASQKRAYKAGLHGNWANPNSTDIHSIYKIKNLSAYLSKYFTKEQSYSLKRTGAKMSYPATQKHDNTVFTICCVERVSLFRSIDGKLWGLSHSLSKLRGIILEITSTIQTELNGLYTRNKTKFRFNDYYTVFYCPIKKWLNDKLPATFAAFQQELANVVGSESKTNLALNLFSGISPPDRQPSVSLAIETAKRVANPVQAVLDLQHHKQKAIFDQWR